MPARDHFHLPSQSQHTVNHDEQKQSDQQQEQQQQQTRIIALSTEKPR